MKKQITKKRAKYLQGLEMHELESLIDCGEISETERQWLFGLEEVGLDEVEVIDEPVKVPRKKPLSNKAKSAKLKFLEKMTDEFKEYLVSYYKAGGANQYEDHFEFMEATFKQFIAVHTSEDEA